MATMDTRISTLHRALMSCHLTNQVLAQSCLLSDQILPNRTPKDIIY